MGNHLDQHSKISIPKRHTKALNWLYISEPSNATRCLLVLQNDNFHHHILLLWLRPNFRRTHDDAMQMMKQAIKGLVWPLGIFSCQSTCILACPKVAQYGWHVWPDRNGKVFVRSIAAWNPPTIRISIYRCPARFGPTKSSGYIYVAHCTYTLTHTPVQCPV